MSDTDQQAVLTMTIQDKSVLYGAHYVFSAKRWFICADNETVSARGRGFSVAHSDG